MRKCVYVLLLFVIITNCEKRALEPNPIEINTFQANFTFQSFKNKAILNIDNLQTDWDDYIHTKINGKDYYEFKVIENHKSNIQIDGHIRLQLFALLCSLNQEGKPNMLLVQYMPITENNNINYFKLDDFEGNIQIFDLMGNNISIENHKNTHKKLLVDDVLADKYNLPMSNGCIWKYGINDPNVDIGRVNSSSFGGECDGSGGGSGCGIRNRTIYHYTYWYGIPSNFVTNLVRPLC